MTRVLGSRGCFRGALVAVFAVALSGCAIGFPDPATNVTNTGATFNGQIFVDEDSTIEYWFNYGKTKAYGTETPHQTITINDRDAHPVSQAISGLSSGTPYRYQLCADAPDNHPCASATGPSPPRAASPRSRSRPIRSSSRTSTRR